MLTISDFTKKVSDRKQHFIWYPHRNDLSCSPELFKLLQYHINNIWGPYADSTYKMNSREFEQYVIEYRAEKYNLSKNDLDGYVTTWWTESNQQWLRLAKKHYPDGILYYSEDTHYSIPKAADMMDISTCVVKSQPHGEIDYDDFVQKLAIHKDKPAIINLTLGTTVKWANDNPGTILTILDDMKKEDHYIHLDCALSGWFLPFLDSSTKPDIWFHKDIKSMAISWHKFIWCPLSCGIFLTRKEVTKNIGTDISYINSKDMSISWSRSGLAPIFLRDAIQCHWDEWFKKEISSCIENSRYFVSEMDKIWKKTLLNNDSIIVVFDKPADDIVQKRSLACHENMAHAVMMQHVSKNMIDLFVCDIALWKAL